MLQELNVAFDFPCCVCRHTVGVTLKCAGKGLAAPNNLASVKIPCPTCNSINHVFFAANGTLHHVAPERKALAIPEPSCN